MALYYMVNPPPGGADPNDVDYGKLSTEAAFNDIHGALSAITFPSAEQFLALKKEMKAIIKEWSTGSSSRMVRFIRGQAAHYRCFYSKENLARALIGEHKARPNLAIEKKLASAAIKSTTIKANLNSAVKKIHGTLMSSMIDPEKAVITDSHKGKYSYWYYSYISGGFADALKRPQAYSLAALVSVIHDVTDILWANPRLAHMVTIPGSKCEVSILRNPGPMEVAPVVIERISMTDTRDFRHPTGTLKEDRLIIESARQAGMPVWAGPSYTTARFMELSQRSGCSTAELEAVAWALFAFWTNIYFTSQTFIHRFHFVLDMAANYGVSYEAFSYPDIADVP